MYTRQRTKEFTRKLCTLLYYAHMNMYNKINCKLPRFLIMHFYRLIQFHTKRRFCASLSFRVSNSGHPVTYTRLFCMNNPGHKIYHCIPSRSTQRYTLLHNLTILHMETFFAPAYHPCKKIPSKKNCHSLHWHTHARLKRYHLLQNIIQTQIWVKNFPFYFFRVRVRVRVTVQSSTRPK